MENEAADIAARLRDWASDVLSAHGTGVLPDAEMSVSQSSRGILIGHLGEFKNAPTTGLRRRSFLLRFEYRDDADDGVLEEIGTCLSTALSADPTLGGRFTPGDVELMEVRTPREGEGDESKTRIARLAVTDLVT